MPTRILRLLLPKYIYIGHHYGEIVNIPADSKLQGSGFPLALSSCLCDFIIVEGKKNDDLPGLDCSGNEDSDKDRSRRDPSWMTSAAKSSKEEKRGL